MSVIAQRTGVDWSRLGRRGALATAAGLAVIQLVRQLGSGQYGYDFRGGIWGAGRAVLDGRSPFPAANAHQLLLHANGFINPPPLALLGALLAPLPFPVAVLVFNLLCVAGLLGALRLVGCRSKVLYVLCLGSFPFVSSLALGQPDGLLALAAALAWRERDRWPGAAAAAVLIAAKLLAWPLVIWLLVTGRRRQAGLAAGGAVALLLASWSVLGFSGLTAYPRLLAADARAFETRAHSIFTALAGVGVPSAPATVLTVVLAVAAAFAVVQLTRHSDLGWFTAALTLGIFASPVVWQHYLVLLFVPLALTRDPEDPVVWLLALGLWLSPSETPATLAQAWLIPMLALAMVMRIAVLSRRPAGPAAPELL